MTCRFCSQEAVAVFALDEGCACYPNDREQALCCQHINRASPLGHMELTAVLDAPLYEWYLDTQGIRP